MDTGAVIKEIRTKNSLTQGEFAGRLSISRSALTQLEAGNTKPSFEVLRVLAEDFDFDTSAFFPRKKTGKRMQVDIHATDVQRIVTFYREHYSFEYNEVMEDRMIETFLKIETDPKRVDALREVYRIYRIVIRISEKLEQDFIDPLKRHVIKIKGISDLEEKGAEGHIESETVVAKDEVLANLDIIYRDAVLFMSFYGEKLKGLPSMLTEQQVELTRKDSQHLQIMKYSQEKYLKAFLYLLKHVKDLEQVEEYFDVESYWRE